MNFEFSEEQNLLREQAQGFLADNSPPAVARKVLESEADYDESLWQKIVEMGWTATVIPEEYGGSALGYTEYALVVEEVPLRGPQVGRDLLDAGPFRRPVVDHQLRHRRVGEEELLDVAEADAGHDQHGDEHADGEKPCADCPL